MILDAYFDSTFSEHSHGFRAKRGCHTALREIYHTWKGTAWIIEGDIADCFGSLNHDLIISARAFAHSGRAISQSGEKAPRRRVHGGLEAEQNAERRTARLDTQPDTFQHPALKTRQVCRNRTHATLQQREKEKEKPGIPTCQTAPYT